MTEKGGMHQSVETTLRTVDIWLTDRGSVWCLKPATERGETFCHENLGALTDAQRQGEFFCIGLDSLLGLVRHCTEEGLYVKEVLH